MHISHAESLLMRYIQQMQLFEQQEQKSNPVPLLPTEYSYSQRLHHYHHYQKGCMAAIT